MGTYRVAQVCPNGHVATTAADQHSELREAFCSQCGEATITQCPNCSASIRGDYYVEGVFGFGGDYEPSAFCHNCGKAFLGLNERSQAPLSWSKLGPTYPPKNCNSSVPI
jgi:hypothetical protein